MVINVQETMDLIIQDMQTVGAVSGCMGLCAK